MLRVVSVEGGGSYHSRDGRALCEQQESSITLIAQGIAGDLEPSISNVAKGQTLEQRMLQHLITQEITQVLGALCQELGTKVKHTVPCKWRTEELPQSVKAYKAPNYLHPEA